MWIYMFLVHIHLQVVECYASLGSWDEVLSWQKEHESTDFTLPQPAIASSYDTSYVEYAHL